MMDYRAAAGSWIQKYFKMGRLTVGTGADSFREMLFGKEFNEQDYWKAYQSNVWAYRGINAIASAAGQLPIRVVQETAAGNLEPVKNHPFVELVNNPNPFMTRQDLVELLFIFAESTGDAYWLLDDGGSTGRAHGAPLKLSQVKEIWPLPTHQMSVKPDQKEFIAGYSFKPNKSGTAVDLSVAEVMHIRYPSPATLLYGQGAIMPVNGDLSADAYAQSFEKFIMKNLATNLIFLKTDSSFTPDQREEYRRSLANVFKGVRIAFMENGLDFATPQIAAKDLPFLELDARRQKRILGALGVPPLMAGSEDAKYDNAEQQKAVFWENTMLPKIARVGAMLTKKLHAMGENKKLSVIMDTSAVKALQADYSKQAVTAQAWFGMGVPLNNLVKVFGPQGIEEVEGGDVGLVSAGLIPLMDAADPVEMEPEGTPEDAPPFGKPKPEEKPKPEDKPADGEKSISAQNKRLDDAHWKKFIATSEPGFRRLRVAVKQFFKAQKARVLANFDDHTKGFAVVSRAHVDIVLLDLNEETKILQAKTSPILKAIYSKLGKQAVADIGASIDFNIGSPAAAEFLADHVFKFSFDVNKTTRDRITKIMQDKFTEGQAQGQTSKEIFEVIKDALTEEYGFAEKWRAQRIARTESGIAGNAGTMDGMRQTGATHKRWLSSRDSKVRDSHKQENIENDIPIDQPFLIDIVDGKGDVVGIDEMDGPGDASASVGNLANCRCAIRVPRIKLEPGES